MSQNLTLKARCWKCGDTFHLVVAPADYNQKAGQVLKLVPCPYCESNCQLTLREDQVFTMEVTRGGAEERERAPLNLLQLRQLEASRTVYDTTEPTPSAAKTGGHPLRPRVLRRHCRSRTD